MEQKTNLANRFGNIVEKLNKAYPDLALQIVLSSLISDKETMFRQIDCILLIASMREIERNKNRNIKK